MSLNNHLNNRIKSGVITKNQAIVGITLEKLADQIEGMTVLSNDRNIFADINRRYEADHIVLLQTRSGILRFVVETDGEFFHANQRRRLCDYKKTEECLNHGINVIRVLYGQLPGFNLLLSKHSGRYFEIHIDNNKSIVFKKLSGIFNQFVENKIRNDSISVSDEEISSNVRTRAETRAANLAILKDYILGGHSPKFKTTNEDKKEILLSLKKFCNYLKYQARLTFIEKEYLRSIEFDEWLEKKDSSYLKRVSMFTEIMQEFNIKGVNFNWSDHNRFKQFLRKEAKLYKEDFGYYAEFGNYFELLGLDINKKQIFRENYIEN